MDPARAAVMALSLMHLASTVGDAGHGYMPSVLSIVNMFAGQRGDASQRVRKTNAFENAETQFLAYLAKVNGPSAPTSLSKDGLVVKANAFTLAGILAQNAGDTGRAVRWLEAARDVGDEIKARGDDGPVSTGGGKSNKDATSSRQPRWDWERRCMEALGQLQADAALAAPASTKDEYNAKRKSLEKARRTLRMAALELDSAKAAMLLATKYAPKLGRDGSMTDTTEATEATETMETTDEAEIDMLLLRAALGLVDGAVDAIARRAAEKAQQATNKDEAAFQSMVAEEWKRIAEAEAAASMEKRQR